MNTTATREGVEKTAARLVQKGVFRTHEEAQRTVAKACERNDQIQREGK